MTDKVQKLYETAGVEKIEIYPPQDELFGTREEMIEFFEEQYPSFTASKQLELIKWLCKNTYRNYFKILFDFQNKTWYMECDCYQTPNKKNFEESLAILTISIWQDLTEEQKQEIKRILE